MSQYKITCLKCSSSRIVGIIKSNGRYVLDWLDNNPDAQAVKIVSGRNRLDDQWGWQCICGNDDIMTSQEKKYISNKQNPDPMEIANLAKSLVPQKSKFAMEKA